MGIVAGNFQKNKIYLDYHSTKIVVTSLLDLSWLTEHPLWKIPRLAWTVIDLAIDSDCYVYYLWIER